MLELYFVTQRASELLQDDMGIIVEESVEGIPLVGAAHFQPPEDGRDGCLVTLKLAYNMPGEFASSRMHCQAANVRSSLPDRSRPSGWACLNIQLTPT